MNSAQNTPPVMVARDSAPRKLQIVPSPMSRRWFFAFFFISGFCSILYEIVWLRLAMAQFGVTSALVSIVLSTFMAGLGLGSWASGRLLNKCESIGAVRAVRFYALAELLIGASAVLVPHELA